MPVASLTERALPVALGFVAVKLANSACALHCP
jgi:hypothetical protein